MNLRISILEVFNTLGKEVPSDDEERIVDAGILDSLSILELVNALEGRFDIFFDEDDLTLENFAKLSSIEHLVTARLAEAQA